MKKIDWKKAEQKLDDRIAGGASFWERINSDPDFLRAKGKLQAKYALPLDYDIRLHNKAWRDWSGVGEKTTSPRAKRGRDFYADVEALLKKFDVPAAWHTDLIAAIAGESIYHAQEVSSSPTFELNFDDHGKLKWRCIITPETDLTNPMNLDLIRTQQKQYAPAPPQPVKDKRNPRQLDWRPVYEWRKKYPLFTFEELAEKLGYSSDRVRLKLAELEGSK